MTVFIDTNVAVDLVTKQEPFYTESAFIADLACDGSIRLQISCGTVATIIYLTFEKFKLQNANDELINFFEKCLIATTDKSTVMKAMRSDFRDKEDAYQYYTALNANADYFLTRDMKDFNSVTPYLLPVLSPLQFEYMLL